MTRGHIIRLREKKKRSDPIMEFCPMPWKCQRRKRKREERRERAEKKLEEKLEEEGERKRDRG